MTERATLKGYFSTGKIPTETQFAQLIDSGINMSEDGIAKAQGGPLKLSASANGAEAAPVLQLYEKFSDEKPAWVVSMSSGQAPKLTFAGPEGSQAELHVYGTITAKRIALGGVVDGKQPGEIALEVGGAALVDRLTVGGKFFDSGSTDTSIVVRGDGIQSCSGTKPDPLNLNPFSGAQDPLNLSNPFDEAHPGMPAFTVGAPSYSGARLDALNLNPFGGFVHINARPIGQGFGGVTVGDVDGAHLLMTTDCIEANSGGVRSGTPISLPLRINPRGSVAIGACEFLQEDSTGDVVIKVGGWERLRFKLNGELEIGYRVSNSGDLGGSWLFGVDGNIRRCGNGGQELWTSEGEQPAAWTFETP